MRNVSVPVPKSSTRKFENHLARKIMAYWRQRGARNVRAEAVSFEREEYEDVRAGVGDALWRVKSNLVNGLPPR